MKKLLISLAIILLLFFACDTSKYAAKEKAKLEQVQQCKLPNGFTVLDFMKISFITAENAGSFAKIKGWYAYSDPANKGYRVIFEYNENDVEKKAEWLARKDSVEANNQLGLLFMGSNRKLPCAESPPAKSAGENP